MKRWIVFCMLFMVYAAGVFAQKRPITHDDLFNLRRVSDPQVSPDGMRIAYTVTVYNKKENSSNSDIWLVSISGGEPRQLTSSPKSDANPRWSPDGKDIAFISGRSGTPQIYVIPVSGGEARRISSVSTGAGGVIWSPDGKQFAFTSTVFPDLKGDAANGDRLKEQAENPVKAKIFDRLLYRHWNVWTNDTRSHIFTIPVSGGEAADMTPGDVDAPPISLGGAQDYVFSPDSREICYVKNTDPVVAVSTNNDLYVVDCATGKERKITGNPANDHSPSYSPDGRFIAYVAMKRPGFESDKLSLMLYDRRTGGREQLTEAYDRSVSQYIWSPDGNALYFTANDRGENSMYAVDVHTKRVDQLTEGSYNANIRITPDGGSLVFLSQAVNAPAEIFTCDISGKNITQLTRTNSGLLAELDMNPVEHFWFEGAEKTQVHGMLLKPPGFDPGRKYPLIFLVHGGPQGMWGDMFHYRWNAQMFAAPGYVVVMVNPRGSTGYGQKFTDEISGDWGGRVFEDLMNGLDYVLETYDFIDKNRLAAAGASFGGYMMNWFEAQTDRFKCLVNHDGVFNTVSMYLGTEELWFPEWEFKGVPWDKNARKVYDKWSPSSYIQNFRTPMLIIHSQLDYRVPLTEGLQAFTALRKMGVPSKFLYFPDEDHWIHKPLNSELWYKTIHEWIAGWLDK